MNRRALGKKLAAFLLASSVLTSTPLTYIAAEDEDLHNQLNNVQQQMNQESNKKAAAEQTITDVFEQLRQIQVQLDQAIADLKSIQEQRTQVEGQIAENEQLLQAAIARLAQREGVFNKRVRDIYINGRLSYLDVIIGSKDFSDFANRMEMLKRILDADIKLINTIKEERQEIADRKAQLEADRAHLVELEKDAQAKQQEIEAKKAERQTVLDKAMSDRDTAERAYEQLQAASADITAMLKQRAAERAAARAAAEAAARAAAAAAAAAQRPAPAPAAPSWVEGSGQLAAPVNAPITSNFGWRIHPIYGTRRLHAGTDFGVGEGTPVHAADSGTVVEAGWISGYGYAVIIDHGNGMSTLYAHNSELVVSAGQTVSKGQVISYSGNTGGSTGPHLHFEVRINGEPQNPLNYL